MKNKDVSFWAQEIFDTFVVPTISEKDAFEEYNYDYIPENGDLLSEIFWDNSNTETEKYSVKEVSSYGGEGLGDTYYKIFRLSIKDSNEEIFIKYYGYYSSWEAVSDWEVKLVTPKQKMITVYEDLK